MRALLLCALALSARLAEATSQGPGSCSGCVAAAHAAANLERLALENPF
jgi:hypothetical protein